MSKFFVYRDTVHKGKPVRVWLCRPFADQRRWSWRKNRAGAARWPTRSEAQAWAQEWPNALVIEVQP